MKKSTLPENKQWEKIVDEAFSSSERHIFSERYEMQKRGLLRGIVIKRRSQKGKAMNNNNKKIAGTIAATAAAAALFPASIFAYNHFGSGTTVPSTDENVAELSEEVIELETEAAEEVVSEQPAEEIGVPNMKAEFGWLPDGLELGGIDDMYGGKYHNAAGGRMSPRICNISKGIIDEQDITWPHDFYSLDDKEIIINYRPGYDPETASVDNFGREVWVKFTDYPYMEVLCFTDDFSDDDIKEISNNLTLVPSDISIEDYWNNDAELGIGEPHGDNPMRGLYYNVDMDRVTLHNIGDTVSSEFIRDVMPEHLVDITLNAAWIQDNFDGITTDTIGWYADYSEYTDENGNILPAERTWYKYNGRFFADTIIKTETVKRHIVVLDLTYTNNTDNEIDDCVCPKMYTYTDGYMHPVGWEWEEGADDLIDTIRLDSPGDMFSFETDKQGSKNHVLLQPGESAHVKLAFAIDDANVGNLYYGAEPANTNDVMMNFYGSPIIDLCSLTVE